MNNKLKGFKFHLKLKGQGGVNYNGVENVYDSELKGTKPINRLKKIKQKVMDEYGNVSYDEHAKISSGCIRYALFKGTNKCDSSTWGFITNACNFISSPMGFMRGYMCADGSAPSGNGFGKASCLTPYDAIETKSEIIVDQDTKSGYRDCNSLFTEEQLGETEYYVNGFFSVKEAQFLSLDLYSGRLGADKEYFEGSDEKNIEDGGIPCGSSLEKAFLKRYGRVPYKVGFFKPKDAQDVFGEGYGAEYGLLFDDEYVNTLINKALNGLLELNIHRRRGEVEAYELKIELIYEGGTKGKEIVVTKDNVNDLTFEIEQFYVEDSFEGWKNRKKHIEEKDKKSKEKKDKKQQEREKWKNSQNKNDNE